MGLFGELSDLKLPIEEGLQVQRRQANKNPITAIIDVAKIGYASSPRQLCLKASIWHPIQAVDIMHQLVLIQVRARQVTLQHFGAEVTNQPRNKVPARPARIHRWQHLNQSHHCLAKPSRPTRSILRARLRPTLRLDSPSSYRACAPPCRPGPRLGRHARMLLEAEQPQQGSQSLKRA